MEILETLRQKLGESGVRGELVGLRTLSLDYCSSDYLAWLQDPDVNRWLEVRWSEQTEQSMTSFVKSSLASSSDLLLAIVDQKTHRHIGNVKIGSIDWNHRCAEIGYLIGDKSFWDRGFATDAIRTALRVCFDDLGLWRVQAGCFGSNLGSIRVLEKNGFRFEGCWRQRLITAENLRDDHLWFGIVKDEFMSLIGR